MLDPPPGTPAVTDASHSSGLTKPPPCLPPPPPPPPGENIAGVATGWYSMLKSSGWKAALLVPCGKAFPDEFPADEEGPTAAEMVATGIETLLFL